MRQRQNNCHIIEYRKTELPPFIFIAACTVNNPRNNHPGRFTHPGRIQEKHDSVCWNSTMDPIFVLLAIQ